MTIETAARTGKIGQRLRAHWMTSGVEINPGVSESELNSFEAKHSVVLPHDLRDYFLSVNGMSLDVLDDQLIRFWMLGEVKTLPDEAPQYADPSYIENPESLFLFADYSIWAHAYAIRLGNFPSNEVVIIGYETPIAIAGSFSEFVDRYLLPPVDRPQGNGSKSQRG